MRITPLGNRVLVKTVEVASKTKTGIFLPDTVSKESPTIAEIVSVGDGDKVNSLRVGDKVIYSKYVGTEIKDGNDKYLILNDSDLLGLVQF